MVCVLVQQDSCCVNMNSYNDKGMKHHVLYRQERTEGETAVHTKNKSEDQRGSREQRLQQHRSKCRHGLSPIQKHPTILTGNISVSLRGPGVSDLWPALSVSRDLSRQSARNFTQKIQIKTIWRYLRLIWYCHYCDVRVCSHQPPHAYVDNDDDVTVMTSGFDPINYVTPK